jgi:hypothetical protein
MSAGYRNRIECHVLPLHAFAPNASDYMSDAEMWRIAFRRDLPRRNADQDARPSHQPHPLARIQVKSRLTHQQVELDSGIGASRASLTRFTTSGETALMIIVRSLNDEQET